MTLHELKIILNGFDEMLSNPHIPLFINGEEIETVELKTNDNFQININTKKKNVPLLPQQSIKSQFPYCPNCGSYNYEVGFPSSGHNCRCRDCGTMFFYNFCK